MSKLKNDIKFKIEQGKGLSATAALKMTASDVRGMSRKELAYMVSTISSAANKRLDRLSKAGQPVEDTINRFSVAGKNRNELLREFSRAKNFMQNERLSLAGQKRIQQGVVSGLAKQEGFSKRDLNKFFRDQDRYNNFWQAWEQLKKNNPVLKESGRYKYRTLKELKNMMVKHPGDSMTEIAQRMQSVVNQAYMDTQQERERETPEDVYTFTGKA